MLKTPSGANASLSARETGGALYDDLSCAIHNGQLQAGDRIAPIRQLAVKYGLPFSAARSAIARLEQHNLVTTKQGSGTYVAPAMDSRPVQTASTSSNLVGLMLPSREHLFDNLNADLIELLGAMGNVGVMPVLPDTDSNTLKTILETWQQNKPHAIVIAKEAFKHAQAIQDACGRSCRLIGTFGEAPDPWHLVNPDLDMAYHLAATHLIDQGHQRIGVITYGRNIRPEAPYTYRKRTAGHVYLIEAVGQLLRKRNIRHGLTLHYNTEIRDNHSDPLAPGEIQAVGQWLTQPNRPTAIIGDDFRLAAAWQAAQKVGLTPGKDLEFVGIGNTPWSKMFHFSSVWLREDLIARQIASLINMGKTLLGDHPHHLSIAPKLIQRQGTL